MQGASACWLYRALAVQRTGAAGAVPAIQLTREAVSVSVNTFGTGMIPDETLAVWLENHVDMRPGVVIRRFGLTRPIYRGLAAYGPFGENGRGMPWERTDLRFPAQF